MYILSIVLIALVLIQPHKSEGGLSQLSQNATIFGVSSDGGPIITITAVTAALLGVVVLAMNILK